MYKSFSLLTIACLLSIAASAQAGKNKARKDSAEFARQIMATREFKMEKQKMDSVFKANGSVAIAASEVVMDDVDVDDDGTFMKDTNEAKDPERNQLTGYIKEQLGKVNVIVYELKYDRVKRRIVSVNKYNDGVDVSVD